MNEFEETEQDEQEQDPEVRVSDDQQELEWVPGPVDRTTPAPSEEVMHYLWVEEFSKVEGGGMEMHCITLTGLGNGQFRVEQPHHTYRFAADDWKKFQDRVARNGQRPRIITAARTIFGPRNGEGPLQ